jgi:hypothetical protein
MIEEKEGLFLHLLFRVAQLMGWDVSNFSLKQLFESLFGSLTRSPVAVLHNSSEI